MITAPSELGIELRRLGFVTLLNGVALLSDSFFAFLQGRKLGFGFLLELTYCGFGLVEPFPAGPRLGF